MVRRAAIGAAAVLAIAVVALLVYYHNRVSTDDAEVDGHVVPIAAKVYGTVAAVMIHDNEAVKEGQVLVRIDPRDYQARVDQAKAALALAEAHARAAGVGVPLTRETTDSTTSGADAQLAAAQANYDKSKFTYERDSTAELAYARANMAAQQANNDRAQADLARMKPLMEKGEISQQQYDAYLAAARVADSQLKAANEKLNSAEKGAEIARESMLAAKAQVDQARAMVAQAMANHKQVSIREADQASAEAAVANGPGGFGSGGVAIELRHHRCSQRRCGHQEIGRSRPDHPARPGALHPDSPERRLGHGEFQRDPACQGASRPEGGDRR